MTTKNKVYLWNKMKHVKGMCHYKYIVIRLRTFAHQMLHVMSTNWESIKNLTNWNAARWIEFVPFGNIKCSNLVWDAAAIRHGSKSIGNLPEGRNAFIHLIFTNKK